MGNYKFPNVSTVMWPSPVRALYARNQLSINLEVTNTIPKYIVVLEMLLGPYYNSQMLTSLRAHRAPSDNDILVLKNRCWHGITRRKNALPVREHYP